MTKTECNGIWVYAEQHNGTLESTPFELLAKAQELKAVLHEEITAVVAGSDISALADARRQCRRRAARRARGACRCLPRT